MSLNLSRLTLGTLTLDEEQIHQDDSTNFNGTIHKELFGLRLKELGLYYVL